MSFLILINLDSYHNLFKTDICAKRFYIQKALSYTLPELSKVEICFYFAVLTSLDLCDNFN